MKRFVKKLLSNRLMLRLSKGNRFIFLFHDIANEDANQYSPHYSTTVDTFIAQIDLLNSLFDIVSLDEIVSNRSLDESKNYAAITFDDGFMSVCKKADPILDERNLPYSVFLNGCAIEHDQIWVSNVCKADKSDDYVSKLMHKANVKKRAGEDAVAAIMNRADFSEAFKLAYRRVGSTRKTYLDKIAIAKLLKKNVLMGNHSYDHFVMSALSFDEKKMQITKNHQLLSSITDQPLMHFAIPFGKKAHYNAEVIEAIRAEGYKFVYTTNPNRFRSADLENSHFLIPRIGLTSETPAQLLFYINRALLKTYHL